MVEEELKNSGENMELKTSNALMTHEKVSTSLWNSYKEDGYGAISIHSKDDIVSDAEESHTVALSSNVEEEEENLTSTSSSSASSSQSTKKNVTYYNLLRDNKPFRLYMLSYITGQIGE